jgi:hypothetical protein
MAKKIRDTYRVVRCTSARQYPWMLENRRTGGWLAKSYTTREEAERVAKIINEEA